MAVEHYEKALALKVDYPEVHSNLGVIRAAQGRDDEAAAHWRKALQLSDSFGTALTERQRAKLIKTNAGSDKGIELALQKSNQMLMSRLGEQGPGPGDCYLELGSMLFDQWKVDDALAALQRGRGDGNPAPGLAAHIRSSRALLMKGDLAEAEREARRWLALGTTDANVPGTAAEFLEQIKKYRELDRKLPAILKGQEKPGDNADRVQDLAGLCEYRNYPVAAVRYYQDLLTIKPDCTDTLGYAPATEAALPRGRRAW